MKRWLLTGTVLALLVLSILFVYPPSPTGTSLPDAPQLLDTHQLEVLSGEPGTGSLLELILGTIPPDVLVLTILLLVAGFGVTLTVQPPRHQGVPPLEPTWLGLTGTASWVMAAFLSGLLVSQGLALLEPPAFWLHWSAALALQAVLLGAVIALALPTVRGGGFDWLLENLTLPEALVRGTLEFLRYYPYLLLALIVNEILVLRFGDPGLPVSYRFIGTADSPLRTVLILGLVGVGAPIVEELFFRGIFYSSLRARMPTLVSCLLAGGLFGLVHFEYRVVLPLGVFGAILCYVYERSGSIKVVITMHFLQNTISLYMIKRFFG